MIRDRQYFLGLGLSLLALFTSASCEQTQKEAVSQEKIINLNNQGLDLLSNGPYSTQRIIYALPAAVDPLINKDFKTDVRGALYLPSDLDSFEAGSIPILVYLHGNAGTCRKIRGAAGVKPLDESDPSFYSVEYTFTGKCGSNYEEAPSYLGLDKAAMHLASHGVAVLAINANRGINGNYLANQGGDTLIDARGQLVLKHLLSAKTWNESSSASEADLKIDLQSRLDIASIGVVGHSRGGEGVRAAAYFLQEQTGYGAQLPGATIKAVFEFAATDGYGSVPFAAKNTPWVSVLASCDGDLVNYPNIQTYMRRVYAGEKESTSLVLVSGANHNFFNEQWLLSDSASTKCQPAGELIWGDKFQPKGNASQYEIGQMFVSAFARAYLLDSADKSAYLNVFDPQFALPKLLLDRAKLYRTRDEGMAGTSLKFKSVDAQSLSALPTKEHFMWTGMAPADLELQAGIRDLVVLMPEVAGYAADNQLQIEFDAAFDQDAKRLVAFNAASFQICGASCSKQKRLEAKVALVSSSGEISSTVDLADYLPAYDETNWVFACPAVFELSDLNNCRSKQIAKDVCLANQLQYSTKHGECFVSRKQSYFNFHTIPVELSDFVFSAAGGKPREIVGLQFVMPQGSSQPLMIDSVMYVRDTDLH